MGYLQVDIPELSIADSINYFNDPNSWPSDRSTSMTRRGTNCLSTLGDYILYDNGTLRITIRTYEYQGGIRGVRNAVKIENLLTGDYQEFGLLNNFINNGYLAIAYNEDASVHTWGLFVMGTLYYYQSYWDNGYTSFGYNNINIYNAILSATIPPITYTWQSVAGVSGKAGIFALSRIKASSINGGDPVTGADANAFDALVTATKLSTLANGKIEEVPIIYSDDENYIAIKDNEDSTCNLRFYLNNQSLLKIQNANQNAYLSILEDIDNKVAKPSIIYKNGNTYSYNTESPSEDTMKNLYRWLHIQTRKKENRTGRWLTSFGYSRVDD